MNVTNNAIKSDLNICLNYLTKLIKATADFSMISELIARNGVNNFGQHINYPILNRLP